MTGAIGTSQEPGASATQPFNYFETVDDGLVCLPEGAAPVYWWLNRQGVSEDFTALYRTEEVFGLWPSRRDITQTWTFGLEIEFGAANREWIASELHARGITAVAEPRRRHTPRSPASWTVEFDPALTWELGGSEAWPGTSFPLGGEVVSPALSDTPETWQQVSTVLEVLRSCGADVSGKCGFHVHFAADALRDGDAAASAKGRQDAFLTRITRLAVLANACFEDVLFRMASAEGGCHRGQPFIYRHSPPRRDEYWSFDEPAQSFDGTGSSRQAVLNLTDVGSREKDIIEFRQSNGTLDRRVVQAFVSACAALIGGARWSPEAVLVSPEPLGYHLALEASTDALVNSAAPLWRLIGAVCPDGVPIATAGALLWLHRRGAWQRSLAGLSPGFSLSQSV